MINDNKISGIIDWGDSAGNSPLYDLARWEYWFGDEFPTSWLLDGYGHKLIQDSKALELFETIKLNISLEAMWWYSEQNYMEYVNNLKAKLLADWSKF
jgi:hypothetical protein